MTASTKAEGRETQRHEARRLARHVLLAQTGHRSSFDGLLRAVQDRLLGYLLRLVGNRALAEDILQDTFLTIVKQLKFLRDPEAFVAWSYRIANRQAQRVLRRAGREPKGDILPDELPAPADEHDAPTREDIDRLMRNASPASQVVLHLHYLEELPLHEVAAILELPLGTVKSRLSYGLAALRRRC